MRLLAAVISIAGVLAAPAAAAGASRAEHVVELVRADLADTAIDAVYYGPFGQTGEDTYTGADVSTRSSVSCRRGRGGWSCPWTVTATVTNCRGLSNCVVGSRAATFVGCRRVRASARGLVIREMGDCGLARRRSAYR